VLAWRKGIRAGH